MSLLAGKVLPKSNIKKEKQLRSDTEKNLDEYNLSSNNGDVVRKRNAIKLEHSLEQAYDDDNANGDDDDEEDEDDFSHDGYSHSNASVQSRSLPPTPEPRNSTPTLLNRPSSKTSQISTNSLLSGSTTSSLSPKPPSERKATSYITVSFD